MTPTRRIALSSDTRGRTGIVARMAGFIAVELAFVATLQACGGPTWVAIGVLACVVQVVSDFRVQPLLALVPAVAWAAGHLVSGNRELFFPFSMYLAAHAAGQAAARGRLTAGAFGGLVVAAFLGVRMLERATPRVLAVECAVATVILAGVLALAPRMSGRLIASALLSAIASVAAYVGLAL